MTEQPPFRAGFAALVGRPNVGKSTLLNALVGEKLSIVTSRPQTTRHRVLGVLNRPGVQLAFVDTPGLHLGERRALNRAMNRTAAAALADADLVVFVVEALRFGEEDEAVLQRIRDSGRESIVVINKVDKVPQKDKLLPFTAELAAKHGFLDVVPVSAEKNVNLDRLIDVIAARLPESPELFPPEQRTDRGIEFQISETIREKLTIGDAVTPAVCVFLDSAEERGPSHSKRRGRMGRGKDGLFGGDEARFGHQAFVERVVLFEERDHFLAGQEDGLQRLLLHVILVFRRLGELA